MRHRRKSQRGRGFMDTLAKGANLAKQGLAAADDAGFSPDDFTSAMKQAAAPTTAPPGIMAALSQAAPGTPQQTRLVDNARQLTPQQVKNAVDLADADARNRAAGGPGLFQGGRTGRKKTRRSRSSGSKRARKTRGRR